MTKKQLNVRIPNLTRRQLDAIKELENMTPGEIVAMAVDRMWRDYSDSEFDLNRNEEKQNNEAQ